MRVEVELPTGKRVYIGGRPLMSEAELRGLHPELGKAIEDHDAIVDEIKTIPDDDLAAIERIFPRFQTAQNEICVKIIELFNPGLDRKECLIDRDTYDQIIEIWAGAYEKKK